MKNACRGLDAVVGLLVRAPVAGSGAVDVVARLSQVPSDERIWRDKRFGVGNGGLLLFALLREARSRQAGNVGSLFADAISVFRVIFRLESIAVPCDSAVQVPRRTPLSRWFVRLMWSCSPAA